MATVGHRTVKTRFPDSVFEWVASLWTALTIHRPDVGTVRFARYFVVVPSSDTVLALTRRYSLVRVPITRWISTVVPPSCLGRSVPDTVNVLPLSTVLGTEGVDRSALAVTVTAAERRGAYWLVPGKRNCNQPFAVNGTLAV
jgi:hypothetical protein